MNKTNTPAALTQERQNPLEICLRQGNYSFKQYLTLSCLEDAYAPAKLVGFVAAGMYPHLYEARLTATPQPAASVASGGEAVLDAAHASLSEIGDALEAAIKENSIPMNDYLSGVLERCDAAIAQLQPRTLDAPVSDIKDQVRKVGGIVHSDGNIFFTNAAQLEAFAAGRTPVAQTEPVQPIPENLKFVIDWLEGGCDPLLAAKELRLLLSAAPTPRKGEHHE